MSIIDQSLFSGHRSATPLLPKHSNGIPRTCSYLSVGKVPTDQPGATERFHAACQSGHRSTTLRPNQCILRQERLDRI